MSNPDDVPADVTPADIQPHLTEVYESSWEIHYHGAVCKFEASSPEDAVLYDLEVPKSIRNRGIGPAMVTVAERTLQAQTDVDVLYAQIGAADGATKHILSNKCGFEVVGVDERETLGRVVDAEKRL